MDPVTAIGLCASIVQLIDATSRVIKYASEVKDAPSRRENLSLEAANLMPLLMRLKQRISSAAPNEQWFSGVRLLGVPGGPIPELEKVVGHLGDRLKTRKKRRGGDLLWPSDEKDCIAILSKIERMKALIGLALQDDQFRLMLALKEDSGTMMENVEVISNNVARLGIDQRSDRDQQILDWLSRQTFGERQKDVLKQMTPGTGSWILQTPGFQSFLADNSKMLWCPGMNGAGKTVLTSFIVDHLETVFLNRNIGIAFVYCNYKELDQTAENLTASLLRQLVQSKPVLPDQISDLYNKHYTRQTRPSLAETIPLIRGIAQTYSKTFVLIDALDEYREQDGTHDTLINALHELHPDVHLLVTSRYVPFIESEFDDAMKVEVRASDENIAAYIRSQVVGARRFQRIIGEDAGLQSNIIEVITKNCQGMFLMAKLHMDSLKSQRDRRSVRLTLEKLPAKLDEAYDQTLDRIKEQGEVDAKIAHCILGWVVHATRPLSLREMQHALAVSPGQTEFDEEAMLDEETLVSVCLGLITIDKTRQQLRLVHFTAQSYLERTRLEFLPIPHDSITSTCLTYLSFNFCPMNNTISSPEKFIEFVHSFALLDYASLNWGIHASKVEHQSNDQVVDFLRNQATQLTTYLALRWQKTGIESLFQLITAPMKKVCGLHLAAHFGLQCALELLLDEGAQIDCLESFFNSALHIAAGNGRFPMVKCLLERGANPHLTNHGSSTPLHLAVKAGSLPISKLLLENVGKIGTSCSLERPPLLQAIYDGHLGIVQALLGEGADPNATSTIFTALILAGLEGPYR